MDASEDHRVVVAYLQKLRLLGRNVYLYLLATFLVGLTVYGGIFTVLLNLYLIRLGYGTEFVGLVNATGGFAFAVFCLPAGALGTRWGSRRTMIAGTGLAVVGFGSLPLAEFVPAALQVVWLLATHTLAWLGLALFFVNSIPFLTNATEPGARTYAFSVRTALGPLAGFAGSLVGGLLPVLWSGALGVPLDQPAPYRYTMFIAVLLLVPAPLVLLSTREPGPNTLRGRAVEAGSTCSSARSAPYGLIALISLVGFLRCAGSGATKTFFNVYLDSELHAPAVMIGTLTAIGKLAAGAAALSLPLLVRLWGTAHTVILGSVGVVLGLLPLAFFPHWLAAGSGFICLMALYTIASLSFTIYSQEAVAPDWRATMSGATNMAAELSGAVMSVGGGYAIAALGYRNFFLIGASMTTMGILVFWMSQIIYRHRRI